MQLWSSRWARLCDASGGSPAASVVWLTAEKYSLVEEKKLDILEGSQSQVRGCRHVLQHKNFNSYDYKSLQYIISPVIACDASSSWWVPPFDSSCFPRRRPGIAYSRKKHLLLRAVLDHLTHPGFQCAKSPKEFVLSASDLTCARGAQDTSGGGGEVGEAWWEQPGCLGRLLTPLPRCLGDTAVSHQVCADTELVAKNFFPLLLC